MTAPLPQADPAPALKDEPLDAAAAYALGQWSALRNLSTPIPKRSARRPEDRR